MRKFNSSKDHLHVITEDIIKLLSAEEERESIEKLIHEAYMVGRKTITTDDWIRDFA